VAAARFEGKLLVLTASKLLWDGVAGYLG